uniref:Leuk-A4-hydro_C domain-containing protein n=1 Tax=Rhabditophanes sp. KR3021 TaxID=114890 RepID=A0AC35U662_9BILA
MCNIYFTDNFVAFYLEMRVSLLNEKDDSSCANFDEITIDHLHLDWDVSFENENITGVVVLDFTVIKPTNKLFLDSRQLNIKSIQFRGQQLSSKFHPNGVLGEKIEINLPELNEGEKDQMTIEYVTNRGASALQFISKEQTVDKKAAYLYSQCQPIHARSIVPCMDTPSVKQSYTATVVVPEGLTCLMSAVADGNAVSANGKSTFKFGQSVPIPSYLLAIVVGDLVKKDISPRCAVWSEESVIDKAHNEFIYTEKMLATAEELLGPYIWGRYDLVVLPTTFPFGGMENPCCTFITPTLLAGDRSLTNVIAHEIAHSWTGNTVTNATWEHFWLNEGFTVFCERKIIGRISGEEMRQFEALSGWESRLVPAVNEVFGHHHEYTKLVPRLNGADPDDAFSTIPYEKGSALLQYLEEILDDIPRFESFVRDYIQKYARQSITTDVWKDYLFEYYDDKRDILDKVDFEKWFHEAGIPPNRPNYDESLMCKCRHLANKWIQAKDEDLNQFTECKTFESMSSVEKDQVLDYIRQGDSKITIEKVKKLTDVYKLDKTENCEIIMSWLTLGLKAEWHDIIEPALAFSSTYGRLKYVKPLYKRLFEWKESKDLAIASFKKNIPFMHPITAHVVSNMLPKED